ncbi:uncharacterized protein LOC124925464 [Impatiens glandulifera]|uniref:uncharacterized protein LOC124925464 n=1 Tax=Impatiens glandulifera TaxID=253017 RepID=UPI001FB10CF7|nr:uncharacterized protein LOC124925464 [Impatiens glandulifera]
MYAWRLKCRNTKWIQGISKHVKSPRIQGYVNDRYLSSTTTTVSNSLLTFSGLRTVSSVVPAWRNSCLRLFSSEGDGRNANNVGAHLEKENIKKDMVKEDIRKSDEHARLGEQDQIEWLNNEKLAIESKRKESPILTRGEKFKNEFLRRIIPLEKLTVSLATFPYYIHKHSKDLLLECVASHLNNNKVATTYGAGLSSSSGRILLQSVPGTELYRERLVKALAQDLKVPLLILDSNVLAPYDFGEENELDDDSAESEEETESDGEDENEANNEEEWTSSGDAKSDATDEDEVDVNISAEALKKLVPYNLEEFEKRVSGECESSSEPSNESPESKRLVKKGDRVKYIGPSLSLGTDNRDLVSGECGDVYEVDGDNVAVMFGANKDEVDGKNNDEANETKPALHWLNVKEIELDEETQAEECYIAIEALYEVLSSVQPLIVYFPDSSVWLSRAVPKARRKEFLNKVQEMLDHLPGPVVLICGQNKAETDSKEKEKITMILPNLGRLAKLPLSLKRLTEGLKPTKRSSDHDIYKLFPNVMSIHPPKEEDVLRTFNKQLEDDSRIVISRSNINELYKVLEEHELTCLDLLHVHADDIILNKQKAEKVVGWAKNHYLSSCTVPSIKGERLYLPRESLEIAITRLKEQDLLTKKPAQNLKNLAKDEYETNFVSAVVPPGEIGIKFDDVGALEEVKQALDELVILPMRRPELFTHGNLLRPCKGILLFGPPGTGKTLLAKALATEAGANFISITGSTLTSKWFGDAEKLTKALFSFASKLAPVIVFVDEIDSLLGARGGAFEHEATRRMRNEFMAAWDGLRSKDSQRILILGATNRPFDLDDAVIRRLPRRIYVNLPDANNRAKILKIFLAKENIEPGFQFEKLAAATEGYSGSDLKNLCIAAAYRPVQEIIDGEKKGVTSDSTSAPRTLNLEDFIEAKAKVGPSVSYDATSMNELRKWNEQYGEGGSRKRSPFGFGSIL